MPNNSVFNKNRPFLKPMKMVNQDAYLAMIKQPMDISTVMSKLRKVPCPYTTAAEAIADVTLIFGNVYTCFVSQDEKFRLVEKERNPPCQPRICLRTLIGCFAHPR